MNVSSAKNKDTNKLVLLGFGQVASHLANLAQDYKLIGSSRNQIKCSALEKAGIESFFIKPDFANAQQNEIAELLANAYVLVSFPPDEISDKIFSHLSSRSKKIVYISSTSVYGNYTGIVDESTKPDWQNERSKIRLQAEQYWLNKGAIVLRAPGLYGPESGLHIRLRNGTYRLPPRNDNYISRIHLQDLARIILGAFSKPLPNSSIYLVGDLQPATQIEVIQWLCEKMALPMPSLADPDHVPISLTASRRVNPQKILAELNMELQFRSYREGYMNCLEESDFLKFSELG